VGITQGGFFPRCRAPSGNGQRLAARSAWTGITVHLGMGKQAQGAENDVYQSACMDTVKAL